MEQYVAERKFLYSIKGSNERTEFILRLKFPTFLKVNIADLSGEEKGHWVCAIELEGLSESPREAYGADSLQALALAVNAVEPFLKRLQKRYDLYYSCGDPYFDKT